MASRGLSWLLVVGVAPDPYREQASPGPFDPVHEADMNRFQDELTAGDRLCRQH